ncbi:MAG: Hsp20/alpha crystallin family protein [Thermodesulfobacteria bacterium]|nr:Hsp20/alpha crystallin family protein [Thermodesulfobacteriota bacterium]
MFRPWFSLSDPIWQDFDMLSREMEKIFNENYFSPAGVAAARVPMPAVNIGETADKVLVYLFAPGLDPKSIDLTIEKNLLSIAAGRDTAKELGEDAKVTGYYRKERFSGKFRRIISLPEGLDTSSIEAKYKNGILSISIKKKEEEQTKKIEVKVD